MPIESELVTEGLKLFFIANDSAFIHAIEAACPSSYTVSSVGTDALLNGKAEDIINEARIHDVLLWKWDLKQAHEIARLSKQFREHSIPFIAICEDPADVVPALLTGADEAMTFPLDVELLEARLAVYHRWMGRDANVLVFEEEEEKANERLIMGPITLDLKARMLYVRDEPIELTFKEFELLGYLMQNPGICCTRDDILEQVWDLDFDTGTNMVEVYMFYLRRKLKKYKLSGAIQTVRGAGYRFILPKDEELL